MDSGMYDDSYVQQRLKEIIDMATEYERAAEKSGEMDHEWRYRLICKKAQSALDAMLSSQSTVSPQGDKSNVSKQGEKSNIRQHGLPGQGDDWARKVFLDGGKK